MSEAAWFWLLTQTKTAISPTAFLILVHDETKHRQGFYNICDHHATDGATRRRHPKAVSIFVDIFAALTRKRQTRALETRLGRCWVNMLATLHWRKISFTLSSRDGPTYRQGNKHARTPICVIAYNALANAALDEHAIEYTLQFRGGEALLPRLSWFSSYFMLE